MCLHMIGDTQLRTDNLDTHMDLGSEIVHECFVTLVFKDCIPTQMKYRSDFVLFGVLRVLPQIFGKMSRIDEA